MTYAAIELRQPLEQEELNEKIDEFEQSMNEQISELTEKLQEYAVPSTAQEDLEVFEMVSELVNITGGTNIFSSEEYGNFTHMRARGYHENAMKMLTEAKTEAEYKNR